MKYILYSICILFPTLIWGQLKPNQNLAAKSDINIWAFEEEPIEETSRGFTFSIDLGMYLASKKTANIYNGLGLSQINNQASWYSIPQRFTEVGLNTQANIVQTINENFPEYNGTVTGIRFGADDFPQDMNYSPKIYFALNATYHFSDYWAVVAKSSIANLKSTAVYTMTLEGPTIPQNASEVIQQFDLSGKEQRIHFDLGFKNTSYNDYGFKWFWGAGMSMVGAKVESNTAFIGDSRYELILQNSGNNQLINEFNSAQTAFNVGYYATTGWEMEYQDRFDFGIGFNLSRDVIELGLTEQSVWNKRIYISFGT